MNSSAIRPAIFVLVVVLLLALIPLSRGKKAVSGRVIDAVSSEPLSGALVEVRNRGWGRDSAGGIVWDKDYVSPGVTDGAGRFMISYRVGSSAHVVVSCPGYALHDGWYDTGADVTIRMVRAPR